MDQFAIEVAETSRRSPLGEPCPTCGAVLLMPCTDRAGLPVPYIHSKRQLLASRLPVPPEPEA